MIYLNDKPISVTIFPDNTSQVWKIPNNIIKKYNVIKWEFTHEGEFMHVAQLKYLLDYMDVVSCLVLTYLPYGRQDKEIDNKATFALRTFSDLLNTLKFDAVSIVDPHSSVVNETIRFAIPIYPKLELQKTFELTDSNIVCYPDAGAVSKYVELYPFPWIYGDKVRDQLSGIITKYDVHGIVEGKKVLIVDDICDGGMTFKLLAKQLIDNGAKEVNLFVSHGIFSKGLQTLKDSGIKGIFTIQGEVYEHFNGELTYRRL